MKSKIQEKALSEWLITRQGLLVLPTGTGKTKIAIDAIKEVSPKKVLIIVPTQKLRDISWPKEIKKWKLKTKVEIVCYASIAKIIDQDFDLVIADEMHRVTENNIVFFYNNRIKMLLGLTATNPKDKYELLKPICPVIYEMSLDEAINANAVADYRINIIYISLDNKEKYIEAGNKRTKFLTTEEAQYKYMNKIINGIRYSGKQVPDFLYMKRMRFIYNLKSKSKYAKKFIEDLDYNRLLIFCGSIDQAEYITKYTYHSRTNDKYLKQFIDQKINTLAAVKALNEGINLPLVDTAFIVQLNSKELDLVQRIGRVLRTDKDTPAQIYILVAINTQDEAWVEKATAYFDQAKITRIYGKR